MGTPLLSSAARCGLLVVSTVAACFYQPQVAGTDGTTTTLTTTGTSTVEPTTVDPTTTSTTTTVTPTGTVTTEPVDETTSTGTTTTAASDGSTTTGTTDGSTTDDPAMCTIPDAPDLAVRVEHAPAPSCDSGLEVAFYGVFTGKPDDQTLGFRECMNVADCHAGNSQCTAKQQVGIHIDGPASHVPDFPPGACVSISYVSAGFADPDSCDVRLLRLAKTGPDILNTSVFVAALGVPDILDVQGPLPLTLGFLAGTELADACPHDLVCDRASGRYDLVADFPDMLVTVPMGTESPAALDVMNKQNVKIGTLLGSLYNLRGYALPVDQCEFDWIWLADENRP